MSRRGVLAVFLAFALVIPGGVAAQGAGSGSTTVLRLAPSPRGLALGGAMAALDDAFALEFNPAAVGLAPAQASASFQALPVDASAGAAVVAFGAPRGAAALSVRFVDYGEVEVVEPGEGVPVGVPTGETATGGEVTVMAGYAIAMGPVRLGLGARWLRVDVAGLTDDAVAADVGAHFAPLDALGLGVVVQNLGPDVEAGRAAPLPVTVRAGARLSGTVGPVDALLAVEGRRREERSGVGVGVEVGAGPPSLRAEGRVGFETRHAGDAYSRLVFGGGVRVDRFAVDFAYRALGPLGATRQLGVSVLF